LALAALALVVFGAYDSYPFSLFPFFFGRHTAPYGSSQDLYEIFFFVLKNRKRFGRLATDS